MRLLKSTGDYLKKKAYRNLALGVLCLTSFTVLLVTSIHILPLYVDLGTYDTVRGVAIGFFVVGWFYFLLLKYPSYRAGIIGERKVTRTLARALSNEYSMFNDVNLESVTRGNIDHIVVGPTGIFVLETKNYRGRISYYGDSWEGMGKGRPPSNQARINAMRLKRALNSSESLKSKVFYIQAIVVFANSKVELTERKPPEHVRILRIDELASYIKSKPERFEAEEIKQVEAEIQNCIIEHE